MKKNISKIKRNVFNRTSSNRYKAERDRRNSARGCRLAKY